MNDFLVLYIGMLCFGMIGLGVALTVYEFKKMARSNGKSVRESVEPNPDLARAAVRLKRAL
jgi:hypothetical protein